MPRILERYWGDNINTTKGISMKPKAKFLHKLTSQKDKLKCAKISIKFATTNFEGFEESHWTLQSKRSGKRKYDNGN